MLKQEAISFQEHLDLAAALINCHENFLRNSIWVFSVPFWVSLTWMPRIQHQQFQAQNFSSAVEHLEAHRSHSCCLPTGTRAAKQWQGFSSWNLRHSPTQKARKAWLGWLSKRHSACLFSSKVKLQDGFSQGWEKKKNLRGTQTGSFRNSFWICSREDISKETFFAQNNLQFLIRLIRGQ